MASGRAGLCGHVMSLVVKVQPPDIESVRNPEPMNRWDTVMGRVRRNKTVRRLHMSVRQPIDSLARDYLSVLIYSHHNVMSVRQLIWGELISPILRNVIEAKKLYIYILASAGDKLSITVLK